MDEETLELGGNISLTGFGVLEPGVMVVVKKIVGNYAKKLSEVTKNFEQISLVLKPVHQKEKSELYELHAKMVAAGKPVTAEITDRNLFFALDKVLKKIESEIS